MIRFKFSKVIRKVFIVVVISIAITIVGIVLFMAFSPQFGGNHTSQQLDEYRKSRQFQKGKFINQQETDMKFPLRKVLSDLFKKHPRRNPGI